MNQRIAIAVEVFAGEERVADHFACCSKFIVCELGTGASDGAFETYFNPLAGQHSGTCQIPGYVKTFHIDTIIAGELGANAVSMFQRAGIEVVAAPGMLVMEALEQFRQGRLIASAASRGGRTTRDNHMA